MADKTFLELAREIGTSKQAVYRCFKRLPDEALHEALQKDGVTYLGEALQTRIKSMFSSQTASGEVHHEALHDAPQTASSEAPIDIVIATLKEQLSVKDQQLEEKDHQIAALHRLLEQQNGLALADKKAILQLSGDQAGDDQPPEEPPTATAEPDKSGFFDRLRQLFK